MLLQDGWGYSTTPGGLMEGVFQGLDRAAGKSDCLGCVFATLPKVRD